MNTVASRKHPPAQGGINIQRPGPWGNPFVIGQHGTLPQVVALFDKWLRTDPDPRAVWIRSHIHELGTHTLLCCGKSPCHGHVLAAYKAERDALNAAEHDAHAAQAASEFHETIAKLDTWLAALYAVAAHAGPGATFRTFCPLCPPVHKG